MDEQSQMDDSRIQDIPREDAAAEETPEENQEPEQTPEEPKTTEPDASETPAQEPVVEKAPDTTETKPAEPVPDTDRIRVLEEQNAELQTRLAEHQQGQAPKEPEQPQEPQSPEYLTAEEFDEVFNDRTSFNKVLGKVHQLALQEAYRSIGPMVNNIITQQRRMESHVEEFWQQNPDLKEPAARQMVGEIAAGLIQHNPGAQPATILAETARLAKERIAALRQAGGGTAPETTQPAFAPPTSSNRPPKAKPLGDLERQLEEMTPTTLI